MKKYDVAAESIKLSILIVDIYKFLVSQHEYIMSKQLLRSGTSIGANIHEAEQGSSKKDFLNKMNISLKEANESQYWIKILHQTGYLEGYKQYEMLYNKLIEVSKVLTKIVKTTKTRL